VSVSDTVTTLSVTARHSSSERQPNFSALNRERLLYLTGWPSRWAFTHISSLMRVLCLISALSNHRH